MAERVFTTLGHWVTLDDDALDAAIRDAGIAHPTPSCASAARELFASRAGDAGRAEGADHPRAVHAAAAAISVRGQCAGALRRARRPRPERDDGARQPRGAAGGLARIPTARPAARCRPRWRAPPTSLSRKSCARPASAAIISWPGPTAPAAPMPPRAQMSAALGVDRRRSHRRCRARDRRRPEPAAIALGGDRRAFSTPAARPIRTRPTRLREALAVTGAAQVDEYLGVFLTDDRSHAAQIGGDEEVRPTTIRRSADCFDAEVDRARPADREAPRRDDPRPHRGAAAYRDRGRRELPPREAGARPARL